MIHSSALLLQKVAERIVSKYLREEGATGVLSVDGSTDPQQLTGVDLVARRGSGSTKIKVKPDAYFGRDPLKIADQGLVFYRGPSHSYAFETIAHHVSRAPGWIFSSMADELYYYFLALSHTEEEMTALMDEPDEVFFPELAAENDDLRIMPMSVLRTWFEANHERYTPRPVTQGDHSAWYRIIPEADIDGGVSGVVSKGAILAGLAQRV